MDQQLKQFLNDTLFVIVVYEQEVEKSPAFRMLSSLTEAETSIFIYDNSSEPQRVTSPFVHYVHSTVNNGVARAYNEAFLYAKGRGLKWLCLFDQDTQMSLSYLVKMWEAISRFPVDHVFVPRLRDRIGLVSPFRWKYGAGKRIKHPGDFLPLKDYRFLNSGLLVSSYAFEKAGMYYEKTPLYFSDISFGERLTSVVTRFIVIDKELEHAMSASESVSLLSALHRYRFFCDGARQMGELVGQQIRYKLRAFLRGIKLTWQHRSLEFLKTFFKLSP